MPRDKKGPQRRARAKEGQKTDSSTNHSLPDASCPQASGISPMVRTFIGCLYEPDDIVEVRRLPSGRSTWHLASKLSDAFDELLADNQGGQDIFVAANPRKHKGGTKAEDVACAWSLFADFDGIDLNGARQRWEAAGLPLPTLIVSSGHGIHAYWRLTDPLTDSGHWGRIQKGLIKLLESDPKVHDAPRIMRLPGFANHKPPPEPCTIVDADPSRRYPLDTLAGVIPEAAEPESVAAPKDIPSPRPVSLDILSRATEYAKKWENPSEGERNSAAFYHATQLTRDFGLRLDQAWGILQAWNAGNNPPLPRHELAECLVKGWRYGNHPIGSKLGGLNAELLTQQDGVEARVLDSDTLGAELLSAELPYPDLTFPVNALPKALRGFVSEAARSISCPPDFIAIPLLTGLGAAIGKSRRIQVKRGWEESAALWTMIVGDSGTAKTPALETALRSIVAVSDSADWTWVNDTTVEALAQIMQEKPRGVILIRDELAAWIRGFDQYKRGRGSDEQFFLEAWSGTAAKITRKLDREGRGDRFPIPQPFLSICGGIQPSVLSKLVANDRVESGFAGRFLLAYPPRMLRRYTKDEVSEAAGKQVEELYIRLQKLTFAAGARPEVLRFSEDGEVAWCQWIESHQHETALLNASSPLVPAWTKMEGYAARLMLVVHLIRVESKEVTSEDVDAKTVEMAGKLIAYFKTHAIRVYSEALRGNRPAALEVINTQVSTQHSARLLPPEASPADERAIQWIQKKGNPGIRPTDLVTARIVSTSEEARAVCDRLVAGGLAEYRKYANERAERLYLLGTQRSERAA